MLYLIAKNINAASHLLSGKFYRVEPFLHKSRVLEFADIMVGIKGRLYITQEDREYCLTQNNFLTVFPGCNHFGPRESPPGLSYYWCHFNLTGSLSIVDEEELKQRLMMMNSGLEDECVEDYYILPEFGEIKNTNRVNQLFSQIVDYSVKNNYSPRVTDCAISLLLMELTQITLDRLNALGPQTGGANRQMHEIMEWIRLYYKQGLTVKELAQNFGYSPDYLSTAFRKAVGLPLLQYIHRTQIAEAKQLLLTTPDRIKDIACEVGFNDEKYFMKLFKQHEGVSPSEFRNAYSSTYLSNE